MASQEPTGRAAQAIVSARTNCVTPLEQDDNELGLLHVEQVSKRTGIPVETLRWWRKRGRNEGPKSARLGRRVVYRRSDVDAWVAAQFNDTKSA